MTAPLVTCEQGLRQAEAVVDVRSPGEFDRGAVPGAVNLPLFDNAERAEIGVLYKHMGRGEAVHQGLRLIGSRLDKFVGGFEPFRDRRLLVYCARGGMRSASVASLLDALGFDAMRLQGGYKAYRNHVLAELDRRVPPRAIVVHGQTGVGKTRLLERLPNVLDLEAAAQHRSSLFGAVNKAPRTQQGFEAHLLENLQALDPARPVFVEGESRKVGDAVIPQRLFRAMKAATCVLVTAPLELRVQRIIAEYDRPGPQTRQQLEASLQALAPLVGKARVAELTAHLRRGDLAAVVRPLLTDYYDPRYRHAMRHYRYALEVSAEDLDAAAETLRRFAEEDGDLADGPAGARRAHDRVSAGTAGLAPEGAAG